MKVLSIGHALVDYFHFCGEEDTASLGLHLGTFNHVPGDRLEALLERSRGTYPVSGGSAANTVKLAAQLGLDATFLGKCGKDPRGEIFQSEMQESGVTCILDSGESPTGVCVTWMAGGRRTVATCHSAAGEITPALLKKEFLKDVDVVVVEGFLLYNREVLYHVLRMSQELKIKIAFDPGSLILIDDFREEILALIENFVDYLFLNEEEALALCSMDTAQSLAFLNSKCPCVSLKRGDQGAVIRTTEGEYSLPSIGPNVADPTGAGDGFTAGFLYGLWKYRSPEQWGKAGVLVASEVIKVPGSRLTPDQISHLKSELKKI